jgi:hypothetical protein
MRVAVERNQRTGEKRLRLLEIFSRQWMRNVQLAPNDRIIEVAPAKVDCGGAREKCLQVREPGGRWMAWHTPIAGFDFRSGWRYRLQVAATPAHNPPAGAPNVRYTLVRVLDQLPVTY